METAKTKIKINTPEGLITKRAYSLVQLAKSFNSDIRISTNNSNDVCAKNLFCLQTLDLTSGNELIIEASGTDAKKAVNSIASLIDNF